MVPCKPRCHYVVSCLVQALISWSCRLWSHTSLNVMIFLTMVSYMPQCHDHVDYGLVHASMSWSCWLWSRTCLNVMIMLTMVSYMPQCHHVVCGLVQVSMSSCCLHFHISLKVMIMLSLVSYKPQSHNHVVYGLVQVSLSSSCVVYSLMQALCLVLWDVERALTLNKMWLISNLNLFLETCITFHLSI